MLTSPVRISPSCVDDIPAMELPAINADVISSGAPIMDVDDTSTHDVCESGFWNSNPIELDGISSAPNEPLS